MKECMRGKRKEELKINGICLVEAVFWTGFGFRSEEERRWTVRYGEWRRE